MNVAMPCTIRAIPNAASRAVVIIWLPLRSHDLLVSRKQTEKLNIARPAMIVIILHVTSLSPELLGNFEKITQKRHFVNASKRN